MALSRIGGHTDTLDAHGECTKYIDEANIPREAGYGSYLIARVVILLSARLYRASLVRAHYFSNVGGQLPQLHWEMPIFNHRFWDIRGNRLRVFGTEETFLEL